MSHEQIIAIVIASGLVAGVGIVVGIFLGVSGKLLSVPSDERQAAVRACLPGNNCGGCGYSGCDGLAKAIADGDAPVNACPVGGDAVAGQIAAALGVDFVTGTKPRRDIYEAALKKAGVPREAAAAVGDQFFTDVWGASRAHIRCLLTRPLSRDTNRFIRFKRVLEKPLWRLYAKENTQ